MEATLGISLYSYLHFNVEKCYVFLFILYVFSSTKLEKKRAELALTCGWTSAGQRGF
jgi:hypothetical protein